MSRPGSHRRTVPPGCGARTRTQTLAQSTGWPGVVVIPRRTRAPRRPT